MQRHSWPYGIHTLDFSLPCSPLCCPFWHNMLGFPDGAPQKGFATGVQTHCGNREIHHLRQGKNSASQIFSTKKENKFRNIVISHAIGIMGLSSPKSSVFLWKKHREQQSKRSQNLLEPSLTVSLKQVCLMLSLILLQLETRSLRFDFFINLSYTLWQLISEFLLSTYFFCTIFPIALCMGSLWATSVQNYFLCA